MKAREVFDCVLYQGLTNTDITIINVPSEDDEFNPQTEEWWISQLGNCPPKAIPSGEYIVVFSGEWLQNDDITYTPDVEISDGDIDIYLYKLDD